MGYGQQQPDVVVGADLGESAGRIAGRSDDQHAAFVLGSAGADRIGLGLLERTGGHRGADGRIVAAEGNVEVFESEVRGQPLALVGDGCRRPLQHAAHGQPVAELIESVFIAAHLDLRAGVAGAHERRRLALGVGQRPAPIRELATRSDAFERVRSRIEFFHYLLFGL